MIRTMSKRTPGRTRTQDLWTKRVKNPDGTYARVPSKRHGRGLRWRAEIIDEAGQPQSEAFGRKDDARLWLEKQSAAMVSGTYVDPKSGKTTLACFYREWSSHQVWVAGTRQAMDLALNSVPFGEVALSELRPSHLQAWIKSMQDKPLQASMIHTRFVNLRGVIRAALRDRLLPNDVTANVRLPRQRKASAAMSIPSPTQVGSLLREAAPQFEAFVALCAFGGLRLGEAAALQVGDVDFLQREIHVRRQVQRANGKQVEIRPPKYGSERTVYAPDELIETISEHVRVFRPGDEAERWLFPGEAEHPLHQNSVGYLWRKARDAAGVGYRLYDLRHFYASGLINGRCDVVTVQRALGHASAAETLKTYAHLWPDASDRTRLAARELYAQAAAYPLRTDETNTDADQRI
jgi:integrase